MWVLTNNSRKCKDEGGNWRWKYNSKVLTTRYPNTRYPHLVITHLYQTMNRAFFSFPGNVPSRNADSPSVYLEKGAYRMRAPRRRHPPAPLNLHAHTLSQTSSSSITNASPNILHERWLLLLVFVLAIAVMTCFGVAYYLFATRWVCPSSYIPNLRVTKVYVSQVLVHILFTRIIYSCASESRGILYYPLIYFAVLCLSLSYANVEVFCHCRIYRLWLLSIISSLRQRYRISQITSMA